MSASFNSPIPLSEIESVLAWVDTFKLSRPTKKINRDFSDAVLLAEILCVHYPKLVEMHNYPPRNSHALKLNNWMTLNRKVLKKLKLNLCCNTMEQLANCAPGVIERVLVMVRDKIRRDEDLNKSRDDAEQNLSSGGSYYEACGDDDNVLVVPVKSRVNGVLEIIQQKVVNYQSYLNIKEELKDAKDTTDLLKQKVDHLDNLLKLKEERIDELQKQLERKQSRRKDIEALQNNMSVQFDTIIPPSSKQSDSAIRPASKTASVKSTESLGKLPSKEKFESDKSLIENQVDEKLSKASYTIIAKPNEASDETKSELEKVKSDVFEEAEVVEEKNIEVYQDNEDFKDTEPGILTTIEDAIQKELQDIVRPLPREKENINIIIN